MRERVGESIEALERDFQRMNRAQELTGLAASLLAALTGEEGVTARVAALVREARALEAIDPARAALADRLASASFELADLGAEFESLGQSLTFDAEQAESLTARMNSWLEARRRHGPDVASVAAAREELRIRLESRGDVEGTLARLESEAKDVHRVAVREAAALRVTRERAARELPSRHKRIPERLAS